MNEQLLKIEDIEKRVESWFNEENIGFEKIDKGFWGLSFSVKEREEDYPLGIVIVGNPPLSLKILVELGNVPPGEQWGFFRRMLEMNFADVISGSFSINESNNRVYFIDRIPIQALNKELMLHSLDSVIYSASELKPKLTGYII